MMNETNNNPNNGSDNSSQNPNDNDPLSIQSIAAVVAMGIPIDLAVQAYTIIGDFPDLMINYIYENYY